MDFQLDEDFIKAAEFVLAEYLSKPYDDKTAFPSGDPFREGGREKGFSREYIDRPIHGLVHTLRTIAYTPVLLACFQEKKIKGFEKIDEAELKKIAIAQLFFVAGRGSEQSSTKYHAYHQRGAQYFKDYAEKHLKHIFTDEEIKKYAGIIEDRNLIYKATPQAQMIAYAHAVDLLRTRTDSQVFHKLTDEEKEEANRQKRRAFDGIAVSLTQKFGKENAQAIMEYAWNLFQTTGDSCQPFHVAPNQEGTVGERWPNDAMTFIKKALEVSPVFEQSQYSVQTCLDNILKVQPPKDITIKTPNAAQSPNATSPQQAEAASQGQIYLQLSALKEQAKKLQEEIDGLRVLEEAPNQLQNFIEPLNKQLEELLPKIAQLEAKSPKTQTVYHFGAQNYQVKIQKEPGKDGVARDVVKIPGDGNCCFNAVLVAAKAKGYLPANIKNHLDLRQVTINHMRDKHNEEMRIYRLGDSESEPQRTRYREARESITHTYPDEIAAYNRQFGTSINNMEDYLSHIQLLDTWGGTLELAAMAQVLNIKINNHTTNAPSVVKFGENENQREIHIRHNGYHYDIYVAPDTWQPLNAQDPVIQLEQRMPKARADDRKILDAKIKTENKELNFGPGLTYEGYIEASEAFNNLELSMQRCLDALKKENLAPAQEKMLGEELQSILKAREAQEMKLHQFRDKFRSHAEFEDKISKRYFSLSVKYDDLIEQLKICKGEPKEQSQIIAMLNTLDKEIGFIFRESQRRDKHYHEMAKHQERRLLVKKLVAANAQPQSQAKVANTPALVHLKQFLKANYDPRTSLEENIKRFFQDPYIKGMLHLGGPIGGIEKLNDPHAVWIFRPNKEGDYNGPGVYNQEIIDYYVQQLKLMVEAEAQHPGSYPLYNAMGGNLCVGNDIIRELSSLLNFKEYGALFRLFSDDFNYPDAQSFREDIYDRKHLVDDGPDFHKRGMACALSPFQAMQEESALDFWSHNRNVQGFNRWEKEILPKLKEIVTDPKDIEELKRRHEELIQLSQQIGARMHQFLIPKEEVDKYTWISGAYGFQVPAAMRGGETTHHLSNAMDYYVSSPEGFIQDTEQKRQAYFANNQDPHFQAKKGKVYDTSYSKKRDRERHLAQLQARLYLHPDLFEPGKMEVNTYYSGNPPPQLVAEYNLKVRQFSQRLAGIIIEAKDQNRLQAQKAPHDLLQTIIPLRDLKNAPSTKLEAAKQKLQELVDLGVIDLPSEVQGSDLYKAISRITQMSPMPSNYISLISSELTKQSKSTDDKRNQLSACFYYAIANGDVKTFEALMSYYQSAEYDYKKFPIDFDSLSNGSENASAMVLACKNNRTDMILKLISIRNDSFWSKWAWKIIPSEQPSVNIRRTATESETANQPLHYLAQHANVEAFKQMIASMIKSRNLPSYFYNQGVTLNANNNTPLHILAMNQPDVQQNRLEILNYLLVQNKGAFDTLFGNDAIIRPNNQGISPIMMAALSQNPQAIKLFAQNCGLSYNQTQIYLWISQDPAQRLPQVLNEINEYGTIPGFVPRGWKVPNEIIDNKRDLDEPSLNPPSKISALITQFNEALNRAPNKEAIHSAYEELLAALGFDATMVYIDRLKGEIAQANNGVSIKNLAQLIKEKSITLNVMKTAEDTALIVAAKQGNMQAVIALCQEKTALNIQRTTKDSTGNTALHYLVKLPDSDEAIIALLTHSSWTTDPTRVQDNDGNNPLHLLASLGKEQTLKALDDHFTTKGKLWGQYSGLYNKFGYQQTSGQVVGMVSGNTQFQAAVFAQNKLGLTPIMVALLTHPENQALINYLCKAMNLDAQDQHLYVDLADAIVNKDSVKIESIVKSLNQNKTTGWNPQAPAIQVPQLKKLCEQAPPVRPNVDIK